MMKRLHIALILLAGLILMLGLAGAADSNFGIKNLPQDRVTHDGYICQPSYKGDCANRPPGTYCMSYSDGYIWAIPDMPANGLWHNGGYWHGKKVEIIHGNKADYYHVLGTPLVSIVDRSTRVADSAQAPSPSGSPVTLTIYVHEGDFNGLLLPGVQITGQDAAGNSFENVTDSNGSAMIDGLPGIWKFSFAKEGYAPLDLDNNITNSDESAAYLQRAGQEANGQAQSQELVALKVSVHDGDLNGTLLSGVQITGQDAAGSSFEVITDSSGAAVINGQPGAWKFAFAKEGYDALDLNYHVNQTEEGEVYLVAADTQQ